MNNRKNQNKPFVTGLFHSSVQKAGMEKPNYWRWIVSTTNRPINNSEQIKRHKQNKKSNINHRSRLFLASVQMAGKKKPEEALYLTTLLFDQSFKHKQFHEQSEESKQTLRYWAFPFKRPKGWNEKAQN